MKSSLLQAHIEFFQEHGFISFENLLTPSSLVKPKEVINQRLPIHDVQKSRNLCHTNPEMARPFLKRALIDVLAELTRSKPNCLATDLLLLSPDLRQYQEPAAEEESCFLRDLCSLQDLHAGLILCLKGGDENSTFYPTEEDFVTIFQPKHTLPLEALESMTNTVFWVIGYGTATTRICFQKQDPCGHRFKKQGLAYGDLLQPEEELRIY